ncbi:MAG: hypothetical protein Q4A66_10150 [Eubacteriales bacterium]|nr:hypothetical protein [Eubacteriales bacterium]
MPLPEYTVRYVDLPYGVNGLLVYDENGEPNIYINARSSYDMQRKALRHELRHLLRSDAYSARPIRRVESQK